MRDIGWLFGLYICEFTGIAIGICIGLLVAEMRLRRGTPKRVEVLEEAITEASLVLCEQTTPEDVAAMRIFGKVMDAAAQKRMGI